VVLLQHPGEQDRDLGTASLLRVALGDSCEVRVGLSWSSLAGCLGRETVDLRRWAVLYPHSLRKPLAPADMARPCVLLDREGEPRDVAHRLDGIVALDGTWSQAKALWWRNPWLLKLGRALVHPSEPSIYGKLRKEPRRDAVSTLEAVAEVLVANGEPEAIRTELRRLFRTMVQRARDASKPPSPTSETS
jgi:hypothetical protein